MTNAQADSWIAQLGAFQKHPTLFIGSLDVKAAYLFLGGFMYAVAHDLLIERALDYRQMQHTAIQNRGWAFPNASSNFLDEQMAKRGMAPLEIIVELAAIDIEVIRLAVSS